MKNSMTIFLLILGITFCSAQKTTTNKKVHTKQNATVSTKSKAAKSETVRSTTKLKKDGTPDRRYKANQKLKKDGTPDKRYKGNR